MKTFTELNEKYLAELFQEFKTNGCIVSYVTDGTPTAIAAYLQSKMSEAEGDEVSLDICDKRGSLMKFTLTASKKGDSVAFIPGFEIGNIGQDYIDSDELKFTTDDRESMSLELTKNPEFIDALKNAYMGAVYHDGEWTGAAEASNKVKGLKFQEEQDIAVCAATVFCTILEVLCNNKDSSSDINYTVDNLGDFKVSPTKSRYSVSLSFGKEFKGLCKSDKLADKIANK